MTSVVKVIVCGWYGAGNVGDELLLSTFRDWVREANGEVVAISLDPAYTSKLLGIDAVDIADVEGLAREFSNADLFVLGGGGLFQTYQPLTITGMYDFNKPDVATYARLLMLARQFGMRTLACAQGVGPIEQAESRSLLSEVFSLTDQISVRDDGSKKLLADLGVNLVPVVAPDPIWALPMTLPTAGKPPARGIRVGVVMRPWEPVSGWQSKFVDSVRATLLDQEVTLVWLPYQSRSVPGRSSSDVHFIQTLSGAVGSGVTHEVVSINSPNDAIEAMRDCHALISMRLHAQIVGLQMQLPTLCIEYDPKLSAASEQAGVPVDHRLQLTDQPDRWSHVFCQWWKSAERGEPTVSIDRLLLLRQGAEAHRRVLHESMRDVPRDRRWHGERFDWLGWWSQQRHQRLLDVLDQQNRGLIQLHAEQENVRAEQFQSQQISFSGALKALERQLEQKQHVLSRLHFELMEIGRCAEVSPAQLHMEGELDPFELWIASTSSSIRNALESSRTECAASEQTIAALKVELEIEAGRMRTAELQLRKALDEAAALRQSSSWRVTRPLRSLSRFLRSPRAEWNELRRMRRAPQIDQPTGPVAAAAMSLDVSWAEFSERVLSRRETFRGVFIQELVIDWDVPLYQRPQHVSAAMARLGYLVIYRTDNWAGDNVDGFREVLPNLWLTNSQEVDRITGAVRSLYSTAYAHTPERFAALGRSNVIMYEYIDHIDPQISGEPENIARLVNLKNWAFGGGADVVVASAAALAKEAVDAVGTSRVIVAQNGVDTLHYRNPSHLQTKLPDALSLFREKYKSVVGYFGALAPWLWYEGIDELVKLRTDCGFVFIGPDYYGGAQRLPQYENVLYLGAVNYKILPAYAKTFDVCFIPFEKGEIARTTSPLKLFEYFALEKPVVVTEWMDECVAHPEVYRGGSVGGLSEAINQALAEKDNAALRKRLAQMADENSWESRAQAMAAAFNLVRK
ncbi:polysaccharide pyruvyl transferase family protein [Xanthomonas sp. LMC-A-07]|uniref:polysaccharide pyruvyl transferase family protein n=1 Tax=Xanthomonas sp. LMC-A-07 TaxID=3040329 RepID=UPI0025573B37|nr:polysaccharide pyruvyl transferase family protein [Xanthomonas sp. LMC-A-07]